MKHLYENDLIWLDVQTGEIPWLKLFTKCGSREFSHCDEQTRREVWRVLHVLESEMLKFYQPKKINIASFANYLPKVHWHIMARFEDDSYYPEPVWGKKQREGTIKVVPAEQFFATIVNKL